jgi:hypothetical protein
MSARVPSRMMNISVYLPVISVDYVQVPTAVSDLVQSRVEEDSRIDK